jgi:hypothetical protein
MLLFGWLSWSFQILIGSIVWKILIRNILYRNNCIHIQPKWDLYHYLCVISNVICLCLCMKTQMYVRHILIHVGKIPVQSIYDKNLIDFFSNIFLRVKVKEWIIVLICCRMLYIYTRPRGSTVGEECLGWKGVFTMKCH